MSMEKLASLVTKLLLLTDKQKLQWEQTESSSVFQVSFPEYSIRIFPRQGREGTDYHIAVLNSDGDVIDTASDVSLKEHLTDSYEKMQYLHDAARRSAFGVDKALDNILESLDEKDKD